MEFYRGDIFYIQNTNNNVGSEQNSGRPAIIVSNDMGNQYASLGIKLGSTPSPLNMSNKEVEEMQHYINKLKCELSEKQTEIDHLSSGTTDADTLKISVERELYKNLYEQLLNKLTA